MKKWEYKNETYRLNRQDKSVAEAMTNAGKQGWEAYHLEKGTDFLVVWFKREVS